VPLGLHRLNNLFYNVELLEEAGVDPTGITSLGALFDAMDAVAAETDATPMTHAMANPWPTTQLWAAVPLGQQGYRAYVDFIERNGSEAAVRSAFETTARILEDYVTYDAESLGLTASNNNVINGDAAFVHQGNWTAGTFATASDFEYGDGWGANAFPGTENMYTLHFDSFLYPGDNPTPERSKRWLCVRRQRDRTGGVQPTQGLDPDPDRRRHERVQRVPAVSRRGLRERRAPTADAPARARAGA